MLWKFFARYYDACFIYPQKLLDKSTTLIHWMYAFVWYSIPVLLITCTISIIIFVLTWVLYIAFYWYMIPPKISSFPIELNYYHKLTSPYPNNNFNSYYSNLKENNTYEFYKSVTQNTDTNNNLVYHIHSEKMGTELMYQMSLADAYIDFKNVSWTIKNLHNYNKPELNLSLFDITIFSKIKLLIIHYLPLRYVKRLMNNISLLFSRSTKLQHELEKRAYGYDVDIITELFYFPTIYNLNIPPLMINLDLVKCPNIVGNSIEKTSNMNNIVTNFKRSVSLDYIPNIALKVQEYLSVLPLIFGFNLNNIGFGLRRGLRIKMAENFPLFSNNEYLDTSIHSSVNICGATIRIKPALHVASANLIFETKLPYWKEIIRSHPIITGFIITNLFIFIGCLTIFIISIMIGLYILWSRYSIANGGGNNSNDSNSNLPTGTITYTNCTPLSSYCRSMSESYGELVYQNNHNNNLMIGTKNINVESSGLLPLEIKPPVQSILKKELIDNINRTQTFDDSVFCDKVVNNNIEKLE
ncbi:hypothetical protein ACR3K2_27880 [Cryptosporidium serpentis]